MANGLILRLMEYALYLGIPGQLGDALINMRREVAPGGANSLISLGTLNAGLVGQSK